MDRPKDSAKIRTLNDAFRTTFTGGRVIVTVGVNGLSKELLIHVIGNVRAFNVFMADNDLHGEHDFESFEVGGDKFLWKIDYNDTSPEFGSPDPRLALRLDLKGLYQSCLPVVSMASIHAKSNEFLDASSSFMATDRNLALVQNLGCPGVMNGRSQFRQRLRSAWAFA